MHVKISDAPIQDGYTLTRTDRFTREEFVNEFKKSMRPAARKWVDAHKKEVYTMDDVYQFRNEAVPERGRLREVNNMDHIELLEKLFDDNVDLADYVFDIAEVITDLVEKLYKSNNACENLEKQCKRQKRLTELAVSRAERAELELGFRKIND